MNKLIGGLLLALGAVLIVSNTSEASVVARSPKKVFSLYVTTISSVTPFTVAQATTTIEDQPGAVYELNLSTGAAGDFVVLYDTVPFTTSILNGNTATQATNYQLGPRFYFGSTTAGTKITFDPPMIFYHGLLAIMVGTGDQAGITYEVGRGINGQ